MCCGTSTGVWPSDGPPEEAISRLASSIVGTSTTSPCGMFCSLLREERRDKMIGFLVVGVVCFWAEFAELSFGNEMTAMAGACESVTWQAVDKTGVFPWACSRWDTAADNETVSAESLTLVAISSRLLWVEQWELEFSIFELYGVPMSELRGLVPVNIFLGGLKDTETPLTSAVTSEWCFLTNEGELAGCDLSLVQHPSFLHSFPSPASESFEVCVTLGHEVVTEEDDVTLFLTNKISQLFVSSLPPSSLAEVGGLSYEKLLVGTTRNSGSRLDAKTGAGTRINSGWSLHTVLTRKGNINLMFSTFFQAKKCACMATAMANKRKK